MENKKANKTSVVALIVVNYSLNDCLAIINRYNR